MKKYSLKLSKMQRKVRARRKTWTNKERYENRLKNAARLERTFNHGQRLAEKFIQEAEQELAQEAHEHSDSCAHDYTHAE